MKLLTLSEIEIVRHQQRESAWVSPVELMTKLSPRLWVITVWKDTKMSRLANEAELLLTQEWNGNSRNMKCGSNHEENFQKVNNYNMPERHWKSWWESYWHPSCSSSVGEGWGPPWGAAPYLPWTTQSPPSTSAAAATQIIGWYNLIVNNAMECQLPFYLKEMKSFNNLQEFEN